MRKQKKHTRTSKTGKTFWAGTGLTAAFIGATAYGAATVKPLRYAARTFKTVPRSKALVVKKRTPSLFTLGKRYATELAHKRTRATLAAIRKLRA